MFLEIQDETYKSISYLLGTIGPEFHLCYNVLDVSMFGEVRDSLVGSARPVLEASVGCVIDHVKDINEYCPTTYMNLGYCRPWNHSDQMDLAKSCLSPIIVVQLHSRP